MNNKMKETLDLFQCDFNREIEENFAQVLTENDKVRLFFINENEAFTDGKNIVVDPACGEVFADEPALRRTENFMHLDHSISADPWYALRMITRGQNIHECLHILYTTFPLPSNKDERATTKARKKTLALTANIIEDAFIEAVGCSIYDNLEFFLMFHRVAILFSNTPVQGTVNRAFQSVDTAETRKRELLTEYLDYMGCFLIYPMVEQGEADAEIRDYVESTKQLFLDGSVCGDSEERFEYSRRIFDIIEPLIPEDESLIDDRNLVRMMPGSKTHQSETNSIASVAHKGKSVTVTRRLFTDLEGKDLPIRDFSEQAGITLLDFGQKKDTALTIVLAQGKTVVWQGSQFDCHGIHKDIEIVETKPKPNLHLRKAYQNIYNKYHININSYNSRFTQLLKSRVPVQEEKKLFGAGISSKNLADTKKRYWYRNGEEYGIPDLAVLFLIDGSGSMQGPRRESAMIASVILHEVLKKQGIAHAIVEHRAIYDEPKIEHNILIDFQGKDEDKYNILSLQADEGTREGLSLYWAERYIVNYTISSERLILVLSDGVPAHGIDGNGNYLPPVSTMDTANAARKIIGRGTDIIAVALDDGEDGSCYEALEEIYPSVVACTDLKRLTGQLLGIISKHLQ